MVTEQEQRSESVAVNFAGSTEERELARQVFDVMRARGRFMSADASIRASVASVAQYLAGRGDGADAERLEAAIAANPAVFAVEMVGEERVLATTRGGSAPGERQTVSRHTFARRFMTPLPKPERPAQPVRERARIDPSWATLPAMLGGLDFEEEPEAEVDGGVDGAAAVDVAAVAVAEVAAPPAAVEVDAPTPAPAAVRAPDAPPVPAAPEVATTPDAPAAPEVPAAIVPAEPVPAAAAPVPAAAAPAETTPAEVPTPTVPVAPAPPTPTAPVAPTRTISLPVAATTDVSGVDDAELAAVIRQRLQADPRVANFGEQWMMEDRVPRFSRGDLRRFKDYLQEQEQPLTDDVLVQDVLGIRPGTPDFNAMRFAVNVRLSREHRDFEFVGTSNQRFWSTTGLPQIGTTRRKPNEIGTDFRYLIEETPNDLVHRTVPSVDHILTFYEYQHGLLPYDAEMQALLPGPLVPNQKSAVLTFESPQSYTTYLVELRFPTPNRGGFILGLDDLYAENLVPGAVLSFSRTDNDGHYLVEYLPESAQNARLLELDERRAQRYVFRPTTYACGVDEPMLLSEERFGRLNGEKPLDDKVRRRPEAVVAATFERVGDHREANFSADFRTLLAGVNVERPMSETLLRSILEQDDTGAFSRDPDAADAYTYVPGTTP